MEERSTRGWKEAPCLTQKVDELLGDLTDEAYVREKCLQWEKVKEDEDQYQEAGGRLEEVFFYFYFILFYFILFYFILFYFYLFIYLFFTPFLGGKANHH